MKAVSPARPNSLPTPPLREYYSRILAYIAVAASVAAGNYAHYFSNELLWMVPYTLLYPHLAHHLSARANHTDRQSCNTDNALAHSRCASLGSSASRTASPKMLTLSTVKARKVPAK